MCELVTVFNVLWDNADEEDREDLMLSVTDKISCKDSEKAMRYVRAHPLFVALDAVNNRNAGMVAHLRNKCNDKDNYVRVLKARLK